MTTRRLFLFVALMFSVASPALAQTRASWYAGAGLGSLHARFEPDYTNVVNGDRSAFVNESDGLQIDLVAGHRRQVSDRFWIGYQGTFNVSRAEWTLSIPEEPAAFRYTVPYAALATVVPEVRISGALF